MPAEVLFSGSDQQALFSIHPSPKTYAEVVVSIMEQFGWQRFLTITNSAGEMFFNDVLCLHDCCDVIFNILPIGTGEHHYTAPGHKHHLV